MLLGCDYASAAGSMHPSIRLLWFCQLHNATSIGAGRFTVLPVKPQPRTCQVRCMHAEIIDIKLKHALVAMSPVGLKPETAARAHHSQGNLLQPA